MSQSEDISIRELSQKTVQPEYGTMMINPGKHIRSLCGMVSVYVNVLVVEWMGKLRYGDTAVWKIDLLIISIRSTHTHTLMSRAIRYDGLAKRASHDTPTMLNTTHSEFIQYFICDLRFTKSDTYSVLGLDPDAINLFVKNVQYISDMEVPHGSTTRFYR